MGLLENIVLTDSIEIKTTPEKIFNFLTRLVDDKSYRAWHHEDHVSLRWLKGQPWEEGSVVYAEEYIHGKSNMSLYLVYSEDISRRINFQFSKKMKLAFS